MTVISKILGVGKGRTAKLAGAVAATLLLCANPSPRLYFLDGVVIQHHDGERTGASRDCD